MKKYGTDPELDKLVDSDNYKDRIKAAEQKYALNKLIDDEDYEVRAVVARQGYGLNQLIYDKDEYVRDAVKDYLKKHNLSIEEWSEQTGHELKKCHKKKNTKSYTSIIIEIDDEDSDGVRICHDIYKRNFWSALSMEVMN